MSINFGRPKGCPACRDNRIVKMKETDDSIYWKCYNNNCRKEWQQLKIPFCVEEK